MARTYFILIIVAYCFLESNQHPSRKIGLIGGHAVSIEDVPYMAHIRDSHKRYVCGGSIIHKKFILTAAHCIDLSKPYTVHVGSEYKDEGDSTDVSNYFVHENYSLYSGNDDVALLKLKEPLKYGKNVARVKLSSANKEIEEGTLVNVTGWGQDEENILSDYLLQVEIPIDSIDNCNEEYDFIEIENSKQFCAGNTEKSSCWGDDGGPVMLNGVQIGIVLRDTDLYCGQKPHLFLNVGAHLRWIEKIINENA